MSELPFMSEKYSEMVLSTLSPTTKHTHTHIHAPHTPVKKKKTYRLQRAWKPTMASGKCERQKKQTNRVTRRLPWWDRLSLVLTWKKTHASENKSIEFDFLVKWQCARDNRELERAWKKNERVTGKEHVHVNKVTGVHCGWSSNLKRVEQSIKKTVLSSRKRQTDSILW